MAKRYTDANKWDDPWYQELLPEHKLAWDYICDKCGPVGVWKPSKKSLDFHTGVSIIISDFLKVCGDRRVFVMPNGNWWIVGFCSFQYAPLDESSKSAPIISYIKLLKKHNLWEAYKKGIHTLKEKEKDKEQDEEKDKGVQGENYDHETALPEALNLTDALCNYFAVKTITSSPVYNSVCDYVATVTHRNELAIASQALQNYMRYKARSQEQRHNITNWIGTSENHYRDGQWMVTDWDAKNKGYQVNGKQQTTQKKLTIEDLKQ